MLSRSQAFAAAFSAKKALLNVNATVNAERTFTFSPSMVYEMAGGVSVDTLGGDREDRPRWMKVTRRDARCRGM